MYMNRLDEHSFILIGLIIVNRVPCDVSKEQITAAYMYKPIYIFQSNHSTAYCVGGLLSLAHSN